MIICTSLDNNFYKYKDDVNNRKVRFHIKNIFHDHWKNYKFKFAHRKRRPIIDKVVDKFLRCKSFLLGYSLFQCPICHNEKIVPHTCKTRFCSSCGNKYNEDSANSIFSKLINWKHRHVVFTIPEDLRSYFRNNRKLLSLLFDAPSITVKYWFNIKFKKFNLTPAFISVLHTYGRPLNFNSHIHVIIAECIIDRNKKLKKFNYFNYDALSKRFMKILLDKMEKHFGKNNFRKIKNDMYIKYSNGFYVNNKLEDDGYKFKSIEDLIKYVNRYCSRL